MRRCSFLVLLIGAIAASAIALSSAAHKAKAPGQSATNKLAAPLRRALEIRPTSGERVHVIVQATENADPNQVRARLQIAGAQVERQLVT
jgi:hypothetical protein